jgi:hypothetical protein
MNNGSMQDEMYYELGFLMLITVICIYFVRYIKEQPKIDRNLQSGGMNNLTELN